MKGSAKLTNDERRRMVLSALSGASVLTLSKEYGVARSWIYALLEDARYDPAAARKEAEDELAFRREVEALVAASPERA